MNLSQEFEKQVNTYIQKGYPHKLDMSDSDFADKIKPLQKHIEDIKDQQLDIIEGILPFVIVINDARITSEQAMELVEKEGKRGVAKLTPHSSENFAPIQSLQIPESFAYLLLNIDRGKDLVNVTPLEALQIITDRKRLPLTINEGIALIILYPEFLIKNNCYSLLGSRNSEDKRVPAIWINAQKHPNLGWCWNGNPHTWLGSASCQGRQSL